MRDLSSVIQLKAVVSLISDVLLHLMLADVIAELGLSSAFDLVEIQGKIKFQDRTILPE